MSYPEQKGWFSRNIKWLIPAGCLGIIVIIVLFATGIAFAVFASIKSSDVYQQSLERAKSNPAAVSALGEPIEAGWYVTGSIKTSGNSGFAKLSIPVSGPKNSGTIQTFAIKRGDSWQFTSLGLEVNGGGGTINLLASGQR